MKAIADIIKTNKSLNRLSIKGGFNGDWGPFTGY